MALISLFLPVCPDELSAEPDTVLPLRSVIRGTNVGKIREALPGDLLAD